MNSIIRFPDTKFLGQVLCTIGTIAVFMGAKFVLQDFEIGAVLIVSVIFTVVGFSVKSKRLPKAFRYLFHVINGMALFLIVASYPSVADGYRTYLSTLEWFYLFHGSYIVVLLGIVGFWRPVLSIFPLTYIAWRKSELAYLFGFKIAWTDYAAVLECGLFMLGGVVAYQAIRTCLKYSESRIQPAEVLVPVVLMAIATHFANYFYAAIEKMSLDSNPFAWALYNNTHNIMLAADVSSMMPLAFSDGSAAFFHAIVNHIVPLINWGTLSLQLCALVALWRLKWAIVLTLLFDLTHIFIFLVSGIFFWKWIILNLAIVAALATLRTYRISAGHAVFLSCCTLTAPLVFHTVPLGWWDTATHNRAYFVAVTRDGKEYEVPSNYFLSGSISVAQQKRVGIPYLGHYQPNRAIGASKRKGVEHMRAANACRRTLGEKSKITPHAYDKLKTYVRRHHAFILAKANAEGLVYYDLFPHHIWSMPVRFKEFHALDKRRIKSYVFHLQSGCTKYENGSVNYDIKLRGKYDIPL